MIFPVLIVIVLAVAFLSLATGSAPVAVLPGLTLRQKPPGAR